ncbi:ribonuclease J [bacterium (Candidatus Blackallbacteria) CG17_big_fil_post_rev_8_21_14_2_50_48_46]|uniref:Ribonuclease J n=1 Tax=bacterium (Candidatus Blackallbacteria) CG17_big_fil_post_rev_8_21_14_2_50_48_46 TaxID=2014261 RepID=A0A2M7G0M7_9BACT|nr:MAG: ribonuclease J [bacterium (Candidatus Blackallbacteria) CG18_big_fil_WC_8_21_14_2_50_49_26]PIW14782.1 MAG: ribonuclease J [bacterium (Candidatus Blackallbacteria) CG17_big_fil_post_rev_8_21_14_2_50_48_46]PIW50884.1 MAG: ribonuclease J [bacterium (Candidatus Blackallbacteria) CG13_big_fil_rev_8_21_14_2_50_49_14]
MSEEIKEQYSVIPLGGIREIGKNMWLVSNEKQMLIIDCGLKFPGEDLYGVDYLLPDFSYVIENQEKLAGIILTHAHEDHVGGLVPLMEKLDSPPPLYATELSLGLLEERVTDIEEGYKSLFHPITGREITEIGSFKVEFMHVCHSISGAVGLAVHTPDGAIVFTGDFKLDPTPIDQKPTDYFKFAELGEQGVLLLIADSTNATQPGYTISEKEVAESFVNAFYRAKGRIIVATFASSLHRIQQVVNRCAEFDRKVAFVGRSMERITAKAYELGYLTYPEGLVVSLEVLDSLPADKVAIITTGSQGEPMAALSRMASGKYNQVQIRQGDTVIISATPIPGNERSIYQNINKLIERGAQVLYDSRKGLHASGHASQEELKLMLNLTKPRYFVPTHGEFRQMTRHKELAESVGIASENIFLLDLGDHLLVSESEAQVSERVTAGEIMVAGRGHGYLDAKELRERHKMVKDGVLFASCTLDEKGQLASVPRLMSKGFIIEDDPVTLYQNAGEQLASLLRNYMQKHENVTLTSEKGEILIQDMLGRIIYSLTRRRPVIVPLVHHLGE